MAKINNKTIVKDSAKSYIVKKVAEMHGVTPRYVYYILAGKKENDKIFATYMDMLEGTNTLVEEVKKLIPFN